MNYAKYKDAFIIKPNKKELTEAAKVEKINTIDDVKVAARIILAQTNATYLVVTLSEEGIVIAGNDDCNILSVKATEVFDVTAR